MQITPPVKPMELLRKHLGKVIVMGILGRMRRLFAQFCNQRTWMQSSLFHRALQRCFELELCLR